MGRIFLGDLDDIFGRILFLFLRLFCGCIFVREVNPGGIIHLFREKGIIILFTALSLAFLGHRLVYG